MIKTRIGGREYTVTRSAPGKMVVVQWGAGVGPQAVFHMDDEEVADLYEFATTGRVGRHAAMTPEEEKALIDEWKKEIECSSP